MATSYWGFVMSSRDHLNDDMVLLDVKHFHLNGVADLEWAAFFRCSVLALCIYYFLLVTAQH
jgi:hypothetical protein